MPLSRTLRLLLAEDSPADAELIWEVLKRAGYPLIFNTVSTPADFEERLRTEDYDIILSDHNLLSWTGMDALEILHRTRQDIPFVVVTATLGDEAALKKAGYKVAVAYDAMQAIMTALRNPPDAILLDVNMPGGTGQQVLRQLKNSIKTNQVPIIVISGSIDSE